MVIGRRLALPDPTAASTLGPTLNNTQTRVPSRIGCMPDAQHHHAQPTPVAHAGRGGCAWPAHVRVGVGFVGGVPDPSRDLPQHRRPGRQTPPDESACSQLSDQSDSDESNVFQHGSKKIIAGLIKSSECLVLRRQQHPELGQRLRQRPHPCTNKPRGHRTTRSLV